VVKDLQALRYIAQVLAITIAAELNNISGKDRSCNRRLSGVISSAGLNKGSLNALA
jgi:hypothetical protein